MTAVRQASGMILVDAGMSFPDEEMPGIDLVLPDFTYLREHANELKGIVLTHGHEDHVGALPYLLREFNVPVYATRMTLGLVRSKLQEFGIKRGDLREIKAGDTAEPGRLRPGVHPGQPLDPRRGRDSHSHQRRPDRVLRGLQDRPHPDRGRADGSRATRGAGQGGRARLLRRLHELGAARLRAFGEDRRGDPERGLREGEGAHHRGLLRLAHPPRKPGRRGRQSSTTGSSASRDGP